MSRARTVAEAERMLAGKCSCLDCGTVVHAYPDACRKGEVSFFDLPEDDSEALASIVGVGLDWLLRQGFGLTGGYTLHSRHCPPTRAKLTEVAIQGDWDAPAQGCVGVSAHGGSPR